MIAAIVPNTPFNIKRGLIKSHSSFNERHPTNIAYPPNILICVNHLQRPSLLTSILHTIQRPQAQTPFDYLYPGL
jgi:hypothetical protein